MSFITGSVSNANPGPTLYALIETAALAIGYTLVDTVTIGSNTHKVLKSAGASGGNSAGLDWYLDINFPTTGTTGGMRFAPFEGYNASTHVATRGPVSQNSTTVDATTFSAFGATTNALETTWTNVASNALSVTLSTAFTYYISITRDRIAVELTSDTLSLAYGGLFTPTSAHTTGAGSALFPLVMTKLTTPTSATSASASSNSSTVATAALTRAPSAPTGSWFNWNTSVLIPVGMSAFFGAGQMGGVGTSPFTSDQEFAAIPVIMGIASTSITTTQAPAVAGYLKDVGVAWGATSDTMGNTVTVGSDTWYSTAGTTNASLLLLRGV